MSRNVSSSATTESHFTRFAAMALVHGEGSERTLRHLSTRRIDCAGARASVEGEEPHLEALEHAAAAQLRSGALFVQVARARRQQRQVAASVLRAQCHEAAHLLPRHPPTAAQWVSVVMRW